MAEPITFVSPNAHVRVNGLSVFKRDVSFGKEFIENGRIYQTSATPVKFNLVPVGSTFKYRDTWYGRTDTSSYVSELIPNGPFGHPGTRARLEFKADFSVRLLQVDDRGAAS